MAKDRLDNGINYINIGLMFISLVAAYILPFEVFLFSYAILGPLHYLTEISWLEKRSYFIRSKNDLWIFGVLIAVNFLAVRLGGGQLVGSFLFSIFIYALLILFVEKLVYKLIFVFLAFGLSVLFNFNQHNSFLFLLMVVWLPSIIHVFLFTGAFILVGALKTKSRSGILSLAVLIMCTGMFFIYTPQHFGMATTDYARKVYVYFRSINISLYHLFGFGTLSPNDPALFINPKAIAIMRFVAFAYTYHYLNWFSKTTIIKWSHISKMRMSIIVVLWMLAVGLYAFSYKTGLYALFLLSQLHVFLEFPLNHQTFVSIGKELKKMVVSKEETSKKFDRC